MKQKLFLVFLLVVTLFACNDEGGEEEISVVDLTDFICLELGRTTLYSLDSVYYSGVPGSINVDSSRWFLKEEIVDILILNEGTRYIMERSLSKDQDSNFIVTGQYTIDVLGDEFVKTEEGVALSEFPIPMTKSSVFSIGKYVDDFRFFSIRGEQVQIFKEWGSVNEIEFITQGNGTDLEEVRIEYVNGDNQIERRRFEQIFSKNKGLSYSYKEILDSQCIAQREDCDEIDWLDKAEKGFIERIEFISTTKP